MNRIYSMYTNYRAVAFGVSLYTIHMLIHYYGGLKPLRNQINQIKIKVNVLEAKMDNLIRKQPTMHFLQQEKKSDEVEISKGQLNVERKEDTKPMTKPIEKPPEVTKENITSLDFSGNDAKLDEMIVKHPNLTSLVLNCQGITRHGINFLSGLKKLTSLTLNNCSQGIDDEAMVFLSKLTNLRELALELRSAHQLTAKGLGCLNTLTSLTSFRITTFQSCPPYLTDEDLKHMSNLTNLTSLSLEAGSLSNSGMNILGKLVNLTSLEIRFQNGCGIDGNGFAWLTKLQNLKSLSIENAWGSSLKQADVSMDSVSKLTGLTSLKLTLPELTDNGIKSLSNPLTSLSLQQCVKLTNEGMKYLSKLTKLTLLNVSYCALIDDEGIKQVINFHDLISLNLFNCPLVTDESLKYVSKLSKLTSLNLGMTNVSDAGLKMLVNTSNLISLSINNAKNVSSRGIKFLQEKLPKLKIDG